MERYVVLALDKYSCYDPDKGRFEVWAEDVYDALDKAQEYFESQGISFVRLVLE